jgi:competence protein ComEC
LAIAQAAGIFLADRGWVRCELALPLAAVALVLGIVSRRGPRLQAASAMAVAFCAGAVALQARLDAARFSPADGVLAATIEGRVTRAVSQADWMWVDLGQVRTPDAGGPSLPRGVRIQGPRTPASLPALESHRAGARIRARVRLKPPRGLENPGSRDRTRSLARRGIGAIGRLAHPALHVEIARSDAVLGALDAIRRDASQRLRAAGPGGALLAALALGDRSGLTLETRDALARLGLTHLIAVSGLHLSLIGALAYAAGRLTLARLPALTARSDTRRLSLFVALGFAVSYALMSGWGVPVRRALVFLIAVALGFLRRSPGRRGHPLALAALVVLAFEPGALFEAGPQMSFAASAAILAGLGDRGQPSREGAIGPRLRRGIDALLRTSAAAIAATAPLAAAHFGRVAPLGALANLVAIPLTAALLLPASLIAAIAALLRPASPLTAFVLSGIAAVASAALRGAEQIAAWLPEQSPIPPPSFPILLLAFGLAALVTRLRATTARVLLAIAGAALLTHCPAPSIVPPPPRVVALDVGQGDAIIVQGRGAVILFDGATAFPGGVDLGRSAVVPALAALGVERLDLVVASHADLDHRGGLSAVIARVPTAGLWIPTGGGRDPAFASLLAAAEERGIEVAEKGRGDRSERFADLHVTPLWPPRSGGLSRNDASLVLRVEVALRRVLLTGDIEAPTEAALLSSGVDLGADVLELPHHGSRTSATSAFLRAVAPSVAIASAPCPGRFGMPHREVLDRASALGIPVWWTGRDGAVLVGLSPGPVVSSWVPPLRARPGCASRAGGAGLLAPAATPFRDDGLTRWAADPG